MYITVHSPIDWHTALDRLSVGAFYLLNVMYRKDIDITDKTLMNETNFGLSVHRRYKRELFDCNYIQAEQVGKANYQYIIGELDGKVHS